MRILLVLIVLIAAIAVLPETLSIGQGHSAGEIFAARCASCHTVPDPGLRTDLAWLDQINRTT